MATSEGDVNLPIEVDCNASDSSADSGLTDMEFVDLYALGHLAVPLLICYPCVSLGHKSCDRLNQRLRNIDGRTVAGITPTGKAVSVSYALYRRKEANLFLAFALSNSLPNSK